MSDFANKMKSAAKFVVAQFPTVTIHGEAYHVRKFDKSKIFDMRSLAGELTFLEGGSQISDTNLMLKSINLAVGSLLVDKDGAKLLKDREDYEWWLEFIADEANAELSKTLLEVSGINQWIKDLADKPKDNAPNVPIEEIALGNSEPS